MTVPLPLPDDKRIPQLIQDWHDGDYLVERYPRSSWLSHFETVLRSHYPQASSKQLTLTARLAAPFPLAKPGVP